MCIRDRLTPVAKMTQRRSSNTDTSELPHELQELLNISSINLSRGEVKELRRILHEFKYSFAVREQSLGRTSLVQHCINTENTNPIRQPPRRPPLSKQEKMSRLLPRVGDTLDTLSGEQWFSTLDLKSGYWQVGLHQEDKEKTAFSTPSGLFQFNVI